MSLRTVWVLMAAAAACVSLAVLARQDVREDKAASICQEIADRAPADPSRVIHRDSPLLDRWGYPVADAPIGQLGFVGGQHLWSNGGSSFPRGSFFGQLDGDPLRRPDWMDWATRFNVAEGALYTVCIDADNPPSPEVFELINDAIMTNPTGLRYDLDANWNAQGAPVHLTWSFVPDGLNINAGPTGDTAGPSTLFATLDAQFAAQGGRATWISRFQQVFDRWEELTGVSYTRVTAPGVDWDDGAAWFTGGGPQRGDIRISMRNITLGGVLAFNYFPTIGDMVIDSGVNWGSFSANTHRYLRNVIGHEHGHGLGLSHSCPQDNARLMQPAISSFPPFDGPRHDDVAGIQRGYGDPFENDNTAGTATHVGAVTPATPINLGAVPGISIPNTSILSIDANNEQDWFRFTAPGIYNAFVTVTPLGLTYDASIQDCQTFNGCCSGNFINSQEIADLAVSLYDSDGTTILATANSEPLGSPETINGVFLGAPGDYYVRVFESNFPQQTQFYTLSISVIEVDCNSNGLLDACDVDCNNPGCNLPGCGQSFDCNGNNLPDECETDCNENGLVDSCDIAAGTSLDCNNNLVPDECDLASGFSNDCNANGTPDECDAPDCNQNLIPDECEIAAGSAQDCNDNGIPDLCEPDCNLNNVPDDCDIAAGTSFDCNNNGLPDECDGDCNGNGLADTCDIAAGTSNDCNGNLIPDECETDCNTNGIADVCEIINLINLQPVSQTACAGADIEFSVGSSVPTATFQWRKGGIDLPGEEFDTLFLDDIVAGDAGSYTCRVNDGCIERISNIATLTVPAPATISTQPPASRTQCVGGTVSISVTAAGTAPFTYNWSRVDGMPINANTSGAALAITNLSAANAGQYRCLVSNACGSQLSNISTIHVTGPVITQDPGSLCVDTNGAAQFQATASASSTIFWQWFKEGDANALTDGGNISGAETDTLTISPVTPADAGHYYASPFTFEPPPLTFCVNESESAALSVGEFGDFDGDGDIDLADAHQFMVCFGLDAPLPAGCECADLDPLNSAIDLDDWIVFESLMTGP